MGLTPLSPRKVRCPRCLRPIIPAGKLLDLDLCSSENWDTCTRKAPPMTDKDRIKIMRALGVKWAKSRAIPTYPATMAEWQIKEADSMYDLMAPTRPQSPEPIPTPA